MRTSSRDDSPSPMVGTRSFVSQFSANSFWNAFLSLLAVFCLFCLFLFQKILCPAMLILSLSVVLFRLHQHISSTSGFTPCVLLLVVTSSPSFTTPCSSNPSEYGCHAPPTVVWACRWPGRTIGRLSLPSFAS